MSEHPSGYRFKRDPSGRTDWTRVEGGDLPAPIQIIFDQSPSGRYVVTGLWIDGGDVSREITSATLRQIRLSEIQAAYFDFFEPLRQLEDGAGQAPAAEEPAGAGGTGGLKIGDVLHLRGIPRDEPNRPRTRRRGPDDSELREFARAYLGELARNPHRAMTATAEALTISRATANRWAALCRERGYLPDADSQEATAGEQHAPQEAPEALEMTELRPWDEGRWAP